MKEEVLSSPIRWAGSKKKVLNEMIELFDKNKTSYIEPFLGSGVVMINVLNNIDVLNYDNIYVNDINKNIIAFYKMLQKKPKLLIKKLKELEELYNNENFNGKESLYYEIRTKFNSISDDSESYFYFLMKVGFNGVYRENKHGNFNVPFGKKDKFIVQEKYLLDISRLIKNVKFYSMSYEKFLSMLKGKNVLNNCFIYCDPPYIPDDQLINQKQALYTNGSFNHNEFVKVINDIDCCKVLISMSESTKANEIYGKYFNHKKLADIMRIINPQKKFESKEIVFLNYNDDRIAE